MIGSQAEQYQAIVDEWKRRVAEIPGWEEDHSEVPVIPGIKLWCWMDDYQWVRNLSLGNFTFVNPRVNIGVQAQQAKSHLNRFIGCVEDLPAFLTDARETVAAAVCMLAGMHPAEAHEVKMLANSGCKMLAYATELEMTQEVKLGVGCKMVDGMLGVTVGFRTPVHTVCPFMLKEADGHSHTQRTYLSADITVPVESIHEAPGSIDVMPIIREINDRMTPAQSRMKIPDEAVHCLRAYTTPTYTEFGGIQLLSILRDTKKQWTQFPERKAAVRISVRSLESIFANDIYSTLEAEV